MYVSLKYCFIPLVLLHKMVYTMYIDKFAFLYEYKIYLEILFFVKILIYNPESKKLHTGYLICSILARFKL